VLSLRNAQFSGGAINMYNCIIFDVDGTLIDTEIALLSSLQKVLEEETGHVFRAENLAFVLGIPGEIALRKLGVKKVAYCNMKWNEYLHDFYHSVKVFDDIENTLARLYEQGVLLGIVTSKTKEELNKDFMSFDLGNYFQLAVCADNTCKHKPDPEPIRKFLDMTGMKPSEVIYVGDTLYDMRCAHGAGVDFGLALWGAKSNERIEAKYVFEKPGQILNIINL